jgi:hypothetical protein
MLTRRSLLSSATVAVPAIALAGCGSVVTPPVITLPSSIIDFIQSAVSAVAKYIPTVESIASLAAALFGPQWAGLIQMGSAALNTLIQYLQSLAPAASAVLRAVPRRTVMPIGIIQTPNGPVQITGYR